MIRFLSRRGMALIAALVILGLTGLIVAVCSQQLVQTYRQARREACVSQAQWLAEGALERALVRLAADDNYEGETWQAVVGSAADEPTGIAIIRVVSVAGEDQQKQIEIDVQYPREPIDGVRYQLTSLVPSAQANP